MSFSGQVKKELMQNVSSSRHCRLAELAALISLSGSSGGMRLSSSTEHRDLQDKIDKLSSMLGLEEDREEMLKALKLSNREGFLQVDPILVERSCCKQAFVRGAFLANGSVTDPQKGYHFEIVCDTLEQATLIKGIIKSFGLEPKLIERKRYFVIYMKDGSMIVDILNVMGAHVSLMDMENVRILKDMRNDVNRRVNCETANINKTVSAAVKQLQDINYIEETKGLKYLPEQLREIAMLRQEEPELPLKELGERLNPPLGKSGVNHRLRKISALAEELRRNL